MLNSELDNICLGTSPPLELELLLSVPTKLKLKLVSASTGAWSPVTLSAISVFRASGVVTIRTRQPTPLSTSVTNLRQVWQSRTDSCKHDLNQFQFQLKLKRNSRLLKSVYVSFCLGAHYERREPGIVSKTGIIQI